MEYKTIKYEVRKENLRKYGSLKGRSLEFSLKALEKQEFEMPAVCH